MYIQIRISFTFVSTNKVIVNMRIEEIIRSNITMDDAKKVILNIMYTQNVISDKFNEILKPFDLSGEQYNVLRILRGQKGCPVNMFVIQDRMIAKNSNTTRLIDKLLIKDLVTRKVCPENRRKIEVLITQKGMNLLETLDPKVISHEQLFAKNITTEEIQILNSLLEKFRTLNN